MSSCGSCSSSKTDDDLVGIVKYRPGDTIREGRYRIEKLAGQGTFGTVLYAFDNKHKRQVAMKVIRSVPRYLEDSHVEIDILRKLMAADDDGDTGVVRLYGSFTTMIRNHRHVCIVFEKLGKSLMDVIQRNNYRGFTLDQVRDYAKQLFKAVAFCHKNKLTHTDLKPENILLVDDTYESPDGRGLCITSTDTRLIDFGGATFFDEHHAKMINTRQYRAPEVMLGLKWSYSSDIWSCGCILPELLTGDQLFATHQNREHFALMVKILNRPLPASMTSEALKPFQRTRRLHLNSRSNSPENNNGRGRSPSTVPVDSIFNPKGHLKWPDKASAASRSRVEKAVPLRDQFDDANFISLIEQCLTYEPDKRLTALEALQHPFFTEVHGDTMPEPSIEASLSIKITLST